MLLVLWSMTALASMWSLLRTASQKQLLVTATEDYRAKPGAPRMRRGRVAQQPIALYLS